MDRLVFKKDEGIKYIDPESKLIPILKADGWKCDDIPDEREEAMKKAEDLGIKVHHKAKTETILAKIKEAEGK